MKKILLLLLFLSFLFVAPMKTSANGMLDVDYNFIDTAFDGIKPVSDKEFQDTINRLTPQPVENTFGAKLKTFLFGRKYGTPQPQTQPQAQETKIDIGGEKKAIEDIKNGTYYIKLVVSLIGTNGDVIPLGNYKIQERTDENVNYLVFYQGVKEYGKLKLQRYEDEQKGENDITYSRVDIVNDNLIRIVYATIKDTKCAYARVYNGY